MKYGAITAKYIFDGMSLCENIVVFIENGVISKILAKNNALEYLQNNQINYIFTDFGDCVIAPSFIDLQQNGGGGVLFNDAINAETLMVMHELNLTHGTGGFLPTLITSSHVDMIQALEVIKNWIELYGFKRGVQGIHLEGPFLSASKAGIHPLEFICKPTDDVLNQIIKYRKYFPIKMTVAIENFTMSQLKLLADNNIILSLGHSNTNYATAINGFNSGQIKCATHLFNAMSGITSRESGVVGAVLNSNCYAGIIVDLHHVVASNVELTYKVKGSSHMYLVTDAVTPAGTDLEEFDFAGKHLWVKDGICVDKNGTLGGAKLTMDQAVANCVTSCNIKLENALRMASLTPAEILGIDKLVGKIKVGYNANLTVINLRNFNCHVIE